MKINPTELATSQVYQYLTGAVAPRPIALASTINSKGQVNLSPYSFFNCFSANPPVLIFSPTRRVRDNTTKHSLHNVEETKEVVINIVNYAIVEQMSLSSTEYGDGVNEFVKSGLTEVASEKVRPPRVAESPVSFECVVKDIVTLGNEGGAGSLVICEVVMIHIDDAVLDSAGQIDPFKIDLVARMGGNWYSRVTEDSVFEIPKPLRNKGIGVDQLPESVRMSEILTGNNLGRLGNLEKLPDEGELAKHRQTKEVVEARKTEQPVRSLHLLARQQLESEPYQALKTLLVADSEEV
ncbi:MAG: flavin reductase family protein [Bacteroidota bacterium]